MCNICKFQKLPHKFETPLQTLAMIGKDYRFGSITLGSGNTRYIDIIFPMSPLWYSFFADS